MGKSRAKKREVSPVRRHGAAFESADAEAAAGTGFAPEPEPEPDPGAGPAAAQAFDTEAMKQQIERVGRQGLKGLEPGAAASKANPFAQHQASASIFASIVDPREKQRVAWSLARLDEYAAAHETLLGQGSKQTHSEMIETMLQDDEEVVPLAPLLCTAFRKAMVESGETTESRLGIKIYLTTRRLMMMDAELHRTPTLSDVLPADERSFFLRTRKRISVEVNDNVWYYPVPLQTVKGVSLDIHYSTRAHGFLSQRRPIYMVVVLVACGLAVLGHLAQQLWASGATEAEVRQRVEAAHAAAAQDASSGSSEDVLFFAQLVVGVGLLAVNPLLFLLYKAYSRSRFVPKMQQSRQITLGVLDPLYQQQSVFFLELDDRYSPVRIRDWLHKLQAFAPHLAGKVLQHDGY